MRWNRGVVAIVMLAAASLAAQQALPQIGVSPQSAREALLRGVEKGYLDYSLGARAFKAASGQARAQLAAGAIGWAKAYTASPEFGKAWAARREAAKPREPQFEGTPEAQLEAQLKKMQADQAKGAEDMKKVMASMPPDQRKMMEEAMQGAAAAAAQMNTPEMRKMQLDGIRMQREGAKTSYDADLARWKTEYPENPAPLIAKRLQAFLDLSADVDYGAQLEPRGDVMRFTNPAYEGKSDNWKLCYRAGRETVEAARAAAQAWLKELQ